MGLGTFLSPVQTLGTGFCFAGGSKTSQQDCSYSKCTSCPPREQLALGLVAPAEDALIWDGRKTTPFAHGETRAVASPAGNPTCSTQACLCCDLERVQTGRILQADVQVSQAALTAGMQPRSARYRAAAVQQVFICISLL